jgi:hypothetical protein
MYPLTIATTSLQRIEYMLLCDTAYTMHAVSGMSFQADDVTCAYCSSHIVMYYIDYTGQLQPW